MRGSGSTAVAEPRKPLALASGCTEATLCVYKIFYHIVGMSYTDFIRDLVDKAEKIVDSKPGGHTPKSLSTALIKRYNSGIRYDDAETAVKVAISSGRIGIEQPEQDVPKTSRNLRLYPV